MVASFVRDASTRRGGRHDRRPRDRPRGRAAWCACAQGRAAGGDRLRRSTRPRWRGAGRRRAPSGSTSWTSTRRSTASPQPEAIAAVVRGGAHPRRGGRRHPHARGRAALPRPRRRARDLRHRGGVAARRGAGGGLALAARRWRWRSTRATAAWRSSGWNETTDVDALELAATVESWGVVRVQFTDVRRDGTLDRPEPRGDRGARPAHEPADHRRGRRLRRRGPGAAAPRSSAFGVDEAIVGKALYEGRVTPRRRPARRSPRRRRRADARQAPDPLPRRRPRPRGEGRALRRRCATRATRSRRRSRYDAEGADELVFLDITASSDARPIVIDMVRRVAEAVYLPFTVGGGVRSGGRRRGRCCARGPTRWRSTPSAVARPGPARGAGAALRLAGRRARDRRARDGARGLRGLRPRRAHADRQGRGRLGARGGRARGGGDPAHEHGPRRDEGRLRPAADARGGRRGARAGRGLGRLRQRRPHGGGAHGRAARARRSRPPSSTSARSASPRRRRSCCARGVVRPAAGGVGCRRRGPGEGADGGRDARGPRLRRERPRCPCRAGPRERRRADGGLGERRGAREDRRDRPRALLEPQPARPSGGRARPPATSCASSRPAPTATATRCCSSSSPTGPACHTGARTCFGETSPTAAGHARGAGARRGASARQAPPEESYTARLLAKGPDQVLKKIGEEATEVVLAARVRERRAAGGGVGRPPVPPAGGAAPARRAARARDGRAAPTARARCAAGRSDA